MLRDDSLPTPYHHKMPMQFKNYDIFYNRDYNLEKIVPNQHNYYEFYFLISGNVTYYIEGRKYTLESGDILLISPNQKHWAFIDDSASVPYERYVLWLSLGYVDSLSSDRTRLSYIFQTSYIISQQIRLSGDLMHHINYLLKRIFINSKSQSYGSDLLANAYISELLVHLAQSSLFSTNGIINYEPAKALNKDSSLVLKVLKYIEDHIYEPIHIDSLCGCFFVSRSHLSKIFSEELGLPVYRYIMKKKLLLARQDIADGQDIQTVSEKYSFGNYSSFYKAFCKEFGQNPQNFKNGAGVDGF